MALSRRRRFAFSAAGGFIAFALLELVARLLPDTVSGQREVSASPRGDAAVLLASQDVPGWDIQYPRGEYGAFPYTTNRWRMRGPDYPEDKGENVVRLILVGDSSMFGHELDWSATIGANLERMVESRSRAVDLQVANCAAPGHSSLQSIYKLERHCMAFDPDVVVIGNVNSDSTRWDVSDRERFHLFAYSGPARLLQSSALFRTLRNGALAWSLRDEQPSAAAMQIPQHGTAQEAYGQTERVPLDEYEDNLRTLIDIARGGDATPVLLVLPTLNLSRGAVPRDGEPSHRDVMRRVAEEEEVLLVDGDMRFRQMPLEPWLFLDEVHPGPAGTWRLAAMLQEQIGALLVPGGFAGVGPQPQGGMQGMGPPPHGR